MAECIVCVTGASGLLASWLVKKLLENGYLVRGTVRDPGSKKVAHLWELPGANERLKLFKADLLSEGVFDSIVEGCEGVFHTASAVIHTAEDPQADIIDPAVLGTLNVLKACKKSTTVKRIVYTSSTATIQFLSCRSSDLLLDESMWSSTEFCSKNKLWYPLSKTLAEQAALDYAKLNGLNLVTVLPSFIVGYVLPSTPTASALDTLTLFKGNTERMEIMKHMGYVHIDDVASAHIFVYENPNANGRYICSALDATNKEVAQLLAEKYPEYNIPTNFQAFEKTYKGLSSKRLEELGFKFKYKGLENMFEDFVKSMKDAGHL